MQHRVDSLTNSIKNICCNSLDNTLQLLLLRKNSLPNLKPPPAGTHTVRTNKTNGQARTRRLERASPLAAGTGPWPACTCHPRPAGRRQPPPARDSDGRPPPHHQPARSEPDPGPCLRLWGLRHRAMSWSATGPCATAGDRRGATCWISHLSCCGLVIPVELSLINHVERVLQNVDLHGRRCWAQRPGPRTPGYQTCAACAPPTQWRVTSTSHDAFFFAHENSLFSLKMHSLPRPPHSLHRPPHSLPRPPHSLPTYSLRARSLL